MNFLNEIIKFEYESEYAKHYHLPLKTKFSTPKIASYKGDLSKRWYVYFSFRDPSTGKMKRMSPIYGGANAFKTKRARMAVLQSHQIILTKLLNRGYNPFVDNTQFYRQMIHEGYEKNYLKRQGPTPPQVPVVDQGMTIKKAIAYVIKQKEQKIAKSGKSTYIGRLKDFEKWMRKHNPTTKTITGVTKRKVIAYLDDVLDRTSPTTRNNYKTDLRSAFQLLEDHEILNRNVVAGIKMIKSKPKRHRAYSDDQRKAIFKYLEEQDPILLLFIKFVSYNLLRPIEVCRLRLKDIDFGGKKLQFEAKNKALKVKIIPDILFEEIKHLSDLDGELFLFTPKVIGGKWNADLSNRRNNFSQRFKRVVKDHFEFGIDYTMYSFRHTYITKLCNELSKTMTQYEAKCKLMLITGHETMEALEKYLRSIDAQLPEDYSHLLKDDA